jgi:Zn-dependent protease with chaperone function
MNRSGFDRAFNLPPAARTFPLGNRQARRSTSAGNPMADRDPESPQAFAAQVRNSLLKGFAIPVVVLVFFALAPAWLNSNLHSSVADNIAKASSLSATEKAERLEAFGRIDFAQICGATHAGLERLRSQMEEAGVCGQFHRLQWGLWLSIALVAILTGVTIATLVLTRRARHSRSHLISAYHLGWRLGIAAALAKVLLLIPLLAYGSFELTTLAFHEYFPKLIILIVVGGLIALGQSIRILLKPVPMEFAAPMARAVSAAQAPRLWADVRAAAARLATAAPDHIVVGMEHNFYVTELAVQFRGGRTAGRTLYLSLPLMQQFAPDEVLAVIGHELGHFRGDDTRITREFYPLRFRANATMAAMAGSGWVGWTSVHALLFFHWSFSSVEQAMSREREFAADRVAAELTSPTVIGRALVKLHVFNEAFLRNAATGAANPFAVHLATYVREQLVPRNEFWTQLFEKKAAHPLDSHPSLRARLESLGRPVEVDQAMVIATTETETAYGRWFEGQDALFAQITAEALEMIGRFRATKADYTTAAGKQLLDQHFPEIHWKARAASMWTKIAFCVAGMAVSVILMGAVDGWELKTLMAAFAFLCGFPALQQWRRHHRAEFVLRADSLSYTGWTRPLLFAEVARVSAVSNYGSITVSFLLKKRARGIARYSILAWIPTKAVSLTLGSIPGKQKENLQTIFRYFTRKMPG